MNGSASPVTHEWVLAHLGAWAMGILSEQDQASFDAHLEGCESCRQTAGRTSRRAATISGSHIPSTLLAQWNERAPLLTGRLREMVQQHLETCTDCRRELETLGFDPDLIRDESRP